MSRDPLPTTSGAGATTGDAPGPPTRPTRRWKWPVAAARPRWFLLGLVTVGLGLRLTGVSHGLPDIFHPDVPKQLVYVPRFLEGDWIPNIAYPMLHVYLGTLLLEALRALDPHGVSPGQIVVTIRLLNAALATAVIPLVFLIGTELFDRRVAAWAAALTSLSALHVLHAHYAMGDAAHAFFVTAALAAAVRVHRTESAAAFLLAGLCAGLAAAAKLYGVLVLGALGVAALLGRRRSWVRGALLAAALAASVIAFVLATPKLLADPAAYVEQYRLGVVTGRPRLPPLLERPAMAGRSLLGLGLDWLGSGLLALGGLGAARLAWRRPAAAALLLATPALVVLMFAAVRASYLDDRNLVILAPFVYLLAGVALAWLGDGGRTRRVAAAALGLTLVAVAAVDALHVAYLFRQEDTRQLAQRWVSRHLPPATRVAGGRYYESEAAIRTEAPDVVALDSELYQRHLDWHSPARQDRVRRAVEFFEARGKLLKRFELWPRAFTSPTLAYYDAASMAVPYAFYPPDAVAGVERLSFVEAGAVPDRIAVVVARDRSATHTLVAREPLRSLHVALSGAGHVEVRHGGRTARQPLSPGDLQVVALEPRRSFPWFKHFYRVTADARDGWVAVRLLTSACDVGAVHVAHGQWARALPHLEACRDARWAEPARLLDLAEAHVRLGAPAAARRALDELERAAPGLATALAALVDAPEGEAWRERYRLLAGHGPWFWHGHTFTVQAETTKAPLGRPLPEPRAEAGVTLRAASPETGPGLLKIRFPQEFLRGAYRVRFRLRGAVPDGGAVARLEVVPHFQRQALEVAASREWAGAGAEGPFQEVEVPVTVALEPAGLEARVYYPGRGILDVDAVSVVPDVRATLAARMAVLRPLLAAAGGGPAAASGGAPPGARSAAGEPPRWRTELERAGIRFISARELKRHLDPRRAPDRGRRAGRGPLPAHVAAPEAQHRDAEPGPSERPLVHARPPATAAGSAPGRPAAVASGTPRSPPAARPGAGGAAGTPGARRCAPGTR